MPDQSTEDTRDKIWSEDKKKSAHSTTKWKIIRDDKTGYVYGQSLEYRKLDHAHWMVNVQIAIARTSRTSHATNIILSHRIQTEPTERPSFIINSSGHLWFQLVFSLHYIHQMPCYCIPQRECFWHIDHIIVYSWKFWREK